ncbi:MAG: polyphosphate kinase 2 family protein [Actinomycetia bacterium]|nr:polyphosphate kinase 2 family protein [Actinomycetes bacterium]
MDVERYRVVPDSAVDLGHWPPDGHDLVPGGKDDGEELHDEYNDRLEQLQELFFADNRHRLLVIIQAIDTGGKDGTIRHVFDKTNPAGVRVAPFKKPSDEELAHDYLWRVHAEVPQDGEIVVFNRSHYEDVLVVRVHDLVPEERWRKRYGHINDFERMLVDEGTHIVKFFLNISKDEQRERLQDRVDRPDKRWKFNKGDLAERERWDEYQSAYTEMLSRTSTDWAPWYVIPADRKWYRNVLVGHILVTKLESLGLSWPQPEEGIKGVVVE